MKIEALQLPNFIEKKDAAEVKGSASFTEILKDSMNKANELQKEADQETQKIAKMETVDIHTAMIAAEKANLTFQTMMQVRNKIIEAYGEIMRMQV